MSMVDETSYCEAHQPPHSVCPYCEAVAAELQRREAEADLAALRQEREQQAREIGLTHQRLDELDEPKLLCDFVPRLLDDLHRQLAEVVQERDRLREECDTVTRLNNEDVVTIMDLESQCARLREELDRETKRADLNADAIKRISEELATLRNQKWRAEAAEAQTETLRAALEAAIEGCLQCDGSGTELLATIPPRTVACGNCGPLRAALTPSEPT